MAQIFVAYSNRDPRAVQVFRTALAGAGITGHFSDYERLGGPTPALQLEAELQASEAVFILVGPGASRSGTAQSWLNWEAGIAAARGRDVWVFEQYPVAASIPVAPVHHYHPYDETPASLASLQAAAKSYADAGPALAPGGPGAAEDLAAAVARMRGWPRARQRAIAHRERRSPVQSAAPGSSCTQPSRPSRVPPAAVRSPAAGERRSLIAATRSPADPATPPWPPVTRWWRRRPPAGSPDR